MTDMDHAGSYPFCPLCGGRLTPRRRANDLWVCLCGYTRPRPLNDDRHREAMRLACYLEDGE